MKNFLFTFILLSSIPISNAQTTKEIKTVAAGFKDMVLVPKGGHLILEEDIRITFTDRDTNYIALINPNDEWITNKQAFYISSHEVTNAEYNIFVSWVKDSLLKTNSSITPLHYHYYSDLGKLESIAILPDSVQWINNIASANKSYPLMEQYHNSKEFNSYPVINISWKQSQAYIYWLNNRMKELLTANHLYTTEWGAYRLPEFSEWENAAMIQYKNGYWFDENQASYYTYAWEGRKLLDKDAYKANFGAIIDQNSVYVKDPYDDGHHFPAPIKSYKPNLLGLYDLSGNISEWTNTSVTLDSNKQNFKKQYQKILGDKYAYLLTELLKENPDWSLFESAIDKSKIDSYYPSKEPNMSTMLFHIKILKQHENQNTKVLSNITDGIMIKGGSWANGPCYMINTSCQVLPKSYTTSQTGFRVALTLNPLLEKMLGKYLIGYTDFIENSN